MKRINFYNSLLITFFVISTSSVKSQESINSAGGNAIGSDGSASYSVGQIEYTSHSCSNGSFSLGVQQTYEIEVVDGIEKINNVFFNCKVYPNPVAESLVLKIESDTQIDYRATLYNSNGKLLENLEINSKESVISMRNIPPTVYFLNVYENDRIVKSFKIVKR